MHDGEATISPDILARYAADAAGQVEGAVDLDAYRAGTHVEAIAAEAAGR